MKFIYLLLLLSLLSCNLNPYAKIDPDIINSGSRAMDKPELEPNYEVNELRIDIIRQTYEECDSDGNTTTYDVSYHPLGFDLGNALFFDLNQNLSLRLDQLFAIEQDEEFIIEVSQYNLPNVKWVYHRVNQEICIERVRKGRSKFIHCRAWEQGKKTVDIAFTKRKGYTIKPNSRDLCLDYYNTSKKECIEKIPNEDKYIYPFRKNRAHTFEQIGDEFLLGDWYKVEYNEIGNNLRFYARGRGKRADQFLWSYSKYSNNFFFANDRYFGWRIQRVNNKIIHYPTGFTNEYVIYERVK